MKQKKQLSELRKFKRPAATIFADRTAYAYLVQTNWERLHPYLCCPVLTLHITEEDFRGGRKGISISLRTEGNGPVQGDLYLGDEPTKSACTSSDGTGREASQP